MTNSFTKTKSGAYGERPPKLKRAVIRADAAVSRSLERSTIAIVLDVEGEMSTLGDGLVNGVGRTRMQEFKKRGSSGVESTIVKVSASRA